jgi:Na+/H+ antiporter NhaD/arsenite permease-like protein
LEDELKLANIAHARSRMLLRMMLVGGLALLAAPALAIASEGAGAEAAPAIAPGLVWVLPFVCLLLIIGIFPLLSKVAHWWEFNRNKLIVSLALAIVTGLYYGVRGYGFAGSTPGFYAVERMLHHAIIADYIPFIVLLFSLYTISGGIRLTGDIPAHPLTNTAFLFVGALLASFVGTTGASMLLIRPLLQINSERRRVKHTVIFFIFLVSNIGGSLLPVGDPPLFLGYLRGVPFLWTLHLLPQWGVALGLLLLVYFLFDTWAYRRELPADIQRDETRRYALKLSGKWNFLLLGGVVLAVGLLVPGRPLPFTHWVLPNLYLREIAQLVLAGLSLRLTPRRIHAENYFNFIAIGEVACLFIGIFVTMQVPIEILKLKGETLGVTTPLQLFWASGMLSSFLDNAPTYAVFFELAGSLHLPNVAVLGHVATATGQIPILDLTAISCGAVFMGANSYIGNGPNFLVKSIAESRGINMPSFFGYMVYSGLILIPIFMVISLIFFM